MSRELICAECGRGESEHGVKILSGGGCSGCMGAIDVSALKADVPSPSRFAFEDGYKEGYRAGCSAAGAVASIPQTVLSAWAAGYRVGFNSRRLKERVREHRDSE